MADQWGKPKDKRTKRKKAATSMRSAFGTPKENEEQSVFQKLKSMMPEGRKTGQLKKEVGKGLLKRGYTKKKKEDD